jgi:hypothetical protein
MSDRFNTQSITKFILLSLQAGYHSFVIIKDINLANLFIFKTLSDTDRYRELVRIFSVENAGLSLIEEVQVLLSKANQHVLTIENYTESGFFYLN